MAYFNLGIEKKCIICKSYFIKKSPRNITCSRICNVKNSKTHLKNLKLNKYRLMIVDDLIDEIWMPCVHHEKSYMVSNMGRVKSLKFGREKLLSLTKTKQGYMSTRLSDKENTKIYKVHRLVCLAFLPNPQQLPCVNHIDEIKDNNNLSNLEWCEHRENVSFSKNKKSKTSIYTGVTFHKKDNRWGARIMREGKVINLGQYIDEHDAGKAYEEALDRFGINNKYKTIQ